MQFIAIHGAACLLGAALSLVPLAATAQSNLGFLRNSPVSRFTDADIRLMLAAGQAVLDSNEPGTSREWRNDKTRNSGRITFQRQFTFENRDCRRLKVESRARSMETQTLLSVCRPAGGAWKVDTQALPSEP